MHKHSPLEKGKKGCVHAGLYVTKCVCHTGGSQSCSCGSWKSQQAEWVFPLSKEDFQCWQMDDGERKKEWGGGFRVNAHTLTHMNTMAPFWKSAKQVSYCIKMCTQTSLCPKPTLCFLFVTPSLYKHCGMSAFLLKSITNEHARIVNSLQCVVIVLTGNLTHDENAARIGFSCYFHLSVTKDSVFEKKRDSERKE